MDERLKQYLQDCKKKNLTWEQVGHVLEGSNYPPETITEAKTWYENPTGIIEPAAPVVTVNPAAPKKKNRLLGLFLALVVLFGLLAGGYGALYMVGTQKLTIPNEGLQNFVEKTALSIPGIPKNPELILEMVSEAHKKVSKSSFEMSLSGQLQASEIESLLGSKALDLQIKGYSDVSDSLNPKFTMNLIFGKEVDVDIRKPDKTMYIKVNKVPVALYAFLGMDPLRIKPLWENWIGIDTSKPETSARKLLDESMSREDSQTEASQATQDIIKKVMTEDILPAVVISEDGDAYKVAFSATPEQINKIVRKIQGKNAETSINPSDILKKFNLDIWIDKKEFLIKEMRVAGSVEIDKNSSGITNSLMPVLSMTSEKQKADFAIVIKMSDFGKDMPIEKPDKYLSPEEFLSEFMKLEPGGLLAGINPTKQLAQARNARRKSDIYAMSSAITAFNVANNDELTKKIPILPTKISKEGFDLCVYLVPIEIVQLPADPEINTQVSDCKKPYDTGYLINKSSDGKITINAPLAENGEVISVTR